MNRYVADTHALYWYLTDSPRLGKRASEAFDEADEGRATICVPAIALAELFYMNEKLGRQLDFRSTLEYLQASGQFTLLPFSRRRHSTWTLTGECLRCTIGSS